MKDEKALLLISEFFVQGFVKKGFNFGGYISIIYPWKIELSAQHVCAGIIPEGPAP